MVQRWIANIRKDDLVAYAIQFGFDPQGTVEELQGRFQRFVDTRGTDKNVVSELTQLKTRHSRTSPGKHDSEEMAIGPVANTTTIAGSTSAANLPQRKRHRGYKENNKRSKNFDRL